MVFHLKNPENEDKNPGYYIDIEQYLKPKCVNKKSKPLLHNKKNLKKPKLRLKLLEHPILIAGHSTKWSILKQKCCNYFKIPRKSIKPERNCKKHIKIPKITTVCHNKTVKGSNNRFSINNIKLPRFLSFLKARDDDGLCKRKSGFEIYCEMASVHGFINFVGATTWQRAFWCFILFLAMAISGFILILSHLMSIETPTILYTENTQYPTWPITFPAVTICNINRISKRKAKTLAERFHKTSNLTVDELADSFRLALYVSKNIRASQEEYQQLTNILQTNNFTLTELLQYLTPNCEDEILRCKWKGRFERCNNLFRKVQTPYGNCCAFNYYTLKEKLNKTSEYFTYNYLQYTTSSGSKTGLTVLLNPDLEDYKASLLKTPGFQVLIHDSHDLADNTANQRIITPTSFNEISIVPQQIHSTDFLKSLDLKARRCYLPLERKLLHFHLYSQTNCLAGCRSELIYKKCQCSLPNWAKEDNWTICGLQDQECILKTKALYNADIKFSTPNDHDNHYATQYKCDCYPLCDVNMYAIRMDSGKLDRRFSLTDMRFFKGINITNHMMLHVFYGDLYGERLRLDVSENWLSFIGTFGGITGLQMGYSFVSGFEMIFFVFVRPACNWLTKKQIKYRIKRKQKKKQAEQEKKSKLEMEKEEKQRIEAY